MQFFYIWMALVTIVYRPLHHGYNCRCFVFFCFPLKFFSYVSEPISIIRIFLRKSFSILTYRIGLICLCASEAVNHRNFFKSKIHSLRSVLASNFVGPLFFWRIRVSLRVAY